MRKAILGCTLAACLVSQVASAFGLDELRCGRFGIYGEALYFKPTGEGVPFVQASDTTGFNQALVDADNPSSLFATGVVNGSIKRRSICRDYDWGFRIGGTYTSQSGCSYAALSGSYIRYSEEARVGGLLSPLLPIQLPTLAT